MLYGSNGEKTPILEHPGISARIMDRDCTNCEMSGRTIQCSNRQIVTKNLTSPHNLRLAHPIPDSTSRPVCNLQLANQASMLTLTLLAAVFAAPSHHLIRPSPQQNGADSTMRTTSSQSRVRAICPTVTARSDGTRFMGVSNEG